MSVSVHEAGQNCLSLRVEHDVGRTAGILPAIVTFGSDEDEPAIFRANRRVPDPKDLSLRRAPPRR